MKRMPPIVAASIVAFASLSGPSLQASAAAKGTKPDPSQCFRTERMSSWASVADRVINVRLQTGAVFQVSLVGTCPGLGLNQTMAFNPSFSSTVCDGKPATVITRDSAGRPLHCAVQSVRALTAVQAAALPDAQRP